MHDSAVKALLATLSAERDALLSGKFGQLLALEDTKSAQFQTLESLQPSGANVQEIRTRLAENQQLIAAAIAGIKSARKRIDALQSVRSGLNVYDKSGAMATVSMIRSALEKKA